MSTPTKAAGEALKKLEDQLRCAICLQLYTQPKLLSCFHVFCEECLSQLVTKSQEGSTVTCPECRRQTPLLESGVAGLQSAFHVHRLFDVRDTLEKVKEPQKAQCDNLKCNDAEATGFCRDCGRFVCATCKRAHQIIDKLASHEVVAIADIQDDTIKLVPPKKKVMYCHKHSENQLRIYCETCQELICVDCTIRLHRDHQYDLVIDVFFKHQNDILAQLEPVRRHLEMAKNALPDFEMQRKKIGDQRQVIEADIHRRIDQLHQALDQRRAELVGQLDQLTQQKLKNLAAQRDQIELLQTQLSSCLEYVEGSLKTGTEGEILAMKSPVVKQIQQLVTEINPDTLHPHEAANLLLVEDHAHQTSKACRNFAAVTTFTDPTQCFATGDGLRAATVGVNAEATLSTRDVYGRRCFSQTAYIRAVLSCSQNNRTVDCDVVKVEDSNCLNVIQYQPVTRGKHHLHIMIGGAQTRGSPHTVVVRPKLEDLGEPVKVIGDVRQPWGVVTNSKRMLIVAENGANCVSVFSPEGEKVQSFGSKGSINGQFSKPCGVTVDNDDYVYVVDSHSHRVQKFTPSGEHISTVGSRGSGPVQFSNPIGIGFNKTNSNLYICDQINNRIQIIDTNLAFLKQFGSKEDGNGQLNHPTGVAFDSDGDVYIVDSGNHCVKIFSPEGQYKRQFGSEGRGRAQLSCPTGITIDWDRVYVTERENRVAIFTTAGQFVHSFGTDGKETDRLRTPRGIAIDINGFIFIADKDSHNIKVY